jgi:hypothetical protein
MTGCSYILGADSDRKQTIHKVLLHGAGNRSKHGGRMADRKT